MSRRATLRAVREQNYPLQAISSLGTIQEEADFMGKKYLRGRSQPLHFFTRVYVKPFSLRLIKRVPNEGADVILDTLTQDWKQYPLPDVLSLDNGLGFVASGPEPRIISPFIQYLLILGIIPFFIAPKKPWMHGAVEGTHSIYTRKVWKRFSFNSLEEVDSIASQFEMAYRDYSNSLGPFPGRTLERDFNWQDLLRPTFIPKPEMNIYLIRLVGEIDNGERMVPAIRLFKELVELEKELINSYVLVRLNVYQENLSIYVEPPNQDLRLVAKRKFPLRFAKKKLLTFI